MLELFFAFFLPVTGASFASEAEDEPTLCSAPTRIETFVSEQGQVCQRFTDYCAGTVTEDCDGE